MCRTQQAPRLLHAFRCVVSDAWSCSAVGRAFATTSTPSGAATAASVGHLQLAAAAPWPRQQWASGLRWQAALGAPRHGSSSSSSCCNGVQGWHGFAARRLLHAAASDAAVSNPALAHKAGQAALLVGARTAGAGTGSSSSQLSPSLALTAGLDPRLRRQLAVWLGCVSGWVASMVVLGGVTRLTRSGLSMTEWRFAGERPPLSQEEWVAEFAKYQASPEFRLAHSHMSVEDFKFIYFMEWAHRMWGRLLGVGFALPAAYFLVRGAINGPLGRRLGLVFAMGGAQGLVGWWMVRSGLKEPADQHHVPRVSPYRLAAHLTSAFAIYATLVWTTLDLARPAPGLAAALASPLALVSAAARQQAGAVAALRRRCLPLAALVGVTAVSGAFVAGLDAGRAFNTFPLMGGRIIPEEYWAPGLPLLRNAFENTAAVQLHHRTLALTTLAGVGALWAAGRRLPLPGPVRTALHVTAALTAAQVTLGITTLLTYVPVSLGAAHQAGALALFTAMLTLLHSARPVSPSAAALAVSRLAPPLAVVATAAIAVAVTQME